jgi:DNA-binding NtrC family response regulator
MGEDVLLIAERIVRQFNGDFGRTVEGFTEAAKERLKSHAWPGNVRELRNVLERAMVFVKTPRIDAADLVLSSPDEFSVLYGEDGAFRFPGGRPLEELERDYILYTLETTKTSYAEIAGILGISKKTLWEKRKRYSLDGMVNDER